MSRIAAVYGGASVHYRSLNEPKYARYLSELIYLPDLARTELRGLDGLVIPCRLHQGLLRAAGERLKSFLEAGGTVVAFGEQPEPILPGVRWEHRDTNFWWWLEPAADSGLSALHEDHSLWRYLSLKDATWHYHGIFRPVPEADTLIVNEEGGAILYIDRATTGGTMVITSLDPLGHFGSYFMPAAERFLDGFLKWFAEELLGGP